MQNFLWCHLTIAFEERGNVKGDTNGKKIITKSPLGEGKFEKPELRTIFLSEIWPEYS